MTHFIANVSMTDFRQVEFDLPDNCDRLTIEIQAIIEAEHKFGNSDEVTIIEIEEKWTQD